MSFLNPFFLIGILGGAVPLLIHLLARKKAKRVEFSSVQFLEEAARTEIRKLKLRQFLLLLLRILAIVFFAVGLARPTLNVPGKVTGEEGAAVAIVFDNSFSMSYETDEGSYLDLGKERALELARILSRRDEAFLILATDPPLTRFETPIREPEKSRGEIEKIAPSERGTDISQAVKMASELLQKSGASSKEIFVFSDMQKSGFKARGKIKLPKGVRLFLVQPGGGPRENLLVEKVEVAGGSFTSEDQVKATVRNDSRRGNNGDAKVFEGETVIGEGELTLDPNSKREVAIPVKFKKGTTWGRVELGKDRLATDDIRYFLLPEKPLRVLALRESSRKVDYLSLALNPWGEGEGYIEPVVRAPSELRAIELSGFKVVILDGVSRVDELTLDRLTSFVFSGGGVLILAGDGIDSDFYTSRLLPRLLPSRIVGIEEARGEGSLMKLRPTVPSHPVFQSFGLRTGESFPGAKFSRFLKIEPFPGSRVIAEFGPGLPALLEGERTLFLTTSADGRWNDLVMNASFAPLLHEIVYFLSKSETERELSVGGKIELEKPSDLAGSRIRCLDNRGNEIRLVEVTKLGKTYLVSEPVERSGIYRVEGDGAKLGMFQVNVDPEESHLASYTRDDLEKLFETSELIFVQKGDKFKDKVITARAGRELSLYFFSLVLLFLSAELWLSRPGRSLGRAERAP